MLPYQTELQCYYRTDTFSIGKAYFSENVEDDLLIASATYDFNSCFLFTVFKKVVILHHMLSKAQVRARPSVLWCYKKELGFSR